MLNGYIEGVGEYESIELKLKDINYISKNMDLILNELKHIYCISYYPRVEKITDDSKEIFFIHENKNTDQEPVVSVINKETFRISEKIKTKFRDHSSLIYFLKNNREYFYFYENQFSDDRKVVHFIPTTFYNEQLLLDIIFNAAVFSISKEWFYFHEIKENLEYIFEKVIISLSPKNPEEPYLFDILGCEDNKLLIIAVLIKDFFDENHKKKFLERKELEMQLANF